MPGLSGDLKSAKPAHISARPVDFGSQGNGFKNRGVGYLNESEKFNGISYTLWAMGYGL